MGQYDRYKKPTKEEILMPENPAELPAEMEGGGGIRRRPIGIGGPPELPPPETRFSIAQLVSEVFRLRDRIHALEGGMLATKLGGGGGFAARSFGGGVGGPNELPEGEGEGIGIGRIRFPGEIHEIAELPTRLATEFASLASRFTQLERNVTQQLATLTQRLDAKR
jgi:hypothetical protein